MKELLTALAKFKTEVDKVKKTGFNPHFKSKFADLGDYIETTEKTLLANDLMIIQTFEHNTDRERVCRSLEETTQQGQKKTSIEFPVGTLKTILFHISGENLTSECPLVIMDDPQKMGSQITYFRRYAYAAILGLVAEDDDANSAMGNNEEATWKTDIPKEKAPVCPTCKCPNTMISQFAGQKYYCDKKKEGCGHKWGGLNNIATSTKKSETTIGNEPMPWDNEG